MANDIIKHYLQNLNYHLCAWSFDTFLAGKNTESHGSPDSMGKVSSASWTLPYNCWWLFTHDTLCNETLIGKRAVLGSESGYGGLPKSMSDSPEFVNYLVCGWLGDTQDL